MSCAAADAEHAGTVVAAERGQSMHAFAGAPLESDAMIVERVGATGDVEIVVDREPEAQHAGTRDRTRKAAEQVRMAVFVPVRGDLALLRVERRADDVAS